MSVINTNQFASGFAQASVQQEFDNAPGAAPGEYAAGFPQSSDNIQYGYSPISLPSASPAYGDGYQFGNSGTSVPGSADFSSILNQIGSLISGLFAQLGSMFGSSQNGTTGSTGTAGGTGTTGTSTPPANGNPETYFANATASSTGDPHLAFDGTTGAGATVSDKWNNMSGHGNLLSSDSFNGGYRVSTQVTAPTASDVTYNASATVTTDAGNTAVTMNKDGSYTVAKNGEDVTLTKGQSTALGNGESVLLGDDGSLTVSDANGTGTISTTLKSMGTYVDVTNNAHDVDLGGYLIHKTDHDVDPVLQSQLPMPGTTNAGTPPTPNQLPIATEPFQIQSYEPGYQPQFQSQLTGALQQPAASELEAFDPDSAGTSLENIQFA